MRIIGEAPDGAALRGMGAVRPDNDLGLDLLLEVGIVRADPLLKGPMNRSSLMDATSGKRIRATTNVNGESTSGTEGTAGPNGSSIMGSA